MQKWLRQNFTIGAIFLMAGAIATGASFAAVLNSNVERLNREVFGTDPDKSLSVKLGKLETKIDMQTLLLKEIVADKQ